MILALATGDNDTRIVVMGLTRQNIDMLLKGNPLLVRAESHPGFPENLVITVYFGETERDVTKQIQALIGEDTKVVIAPKSDPLRKPS